MKFKIKLYSKTENHSKKFLKNYVLTDKDILSYAIMKYEIDFDDVGPDDKIEAKIEIII